MTCGFTGHRQIKYSHAKALPDLLLRAIGYAYSKGCRRFIAGGALGFDTSAAKEVLRFRMTHPDVSLVLYLPCIDQDSGWSDAQRATYEYILASADEVKYLSDSYDRGCMRRRNQAIANECDILIAYVGRDRTGSSQTLRMVKDQGKEAYNLYFELEKGSF